MVTVRPRPAAPRWLFRWRSRPWWQGGLGAIAALLLTALPGWSAEEIILTYGFFERTVSLAELTDFAEGRGLSPALRSYARMLNLSSRDLARIQTLLRERVRLDSPTEQVNEALVIGQFLYTPQGEALLTVVGDVVQIPPRLSGFHAVRAALILAAASEQGLTALSFLEAFPVSALRLDVARGLAIAEVVGRTLNQARLGANLVYGLAAQAAEAESPELVPLAQSALAQAPRYEVTQENIQLPDRLEEATLFFPAPSASHPTLPQRVPVVVISHGLGDTRASFAELGRFLASRGFVVAALDHPGSNSRQIQALLSGLSTRVVEDEEFIQRPEAVSALLDYLTVYASQNTQWRDRLALDRVGVLGHSFGGYTALALAGAPFPSPALEQQCGPQVIYVNPSLLLQCQATNLPAFFNRRDPRVQAIFLINPVGSALFSAQGYGVVTVPTLMLAGVADTVAPALPEQIRPFTWLQEDLDRYLVLMNNGTHFSILPEIPEGSTASIPVPPLLLGPAPAQARRYVETLSLGFFKVHLAGDDRYRAVLTARYLETLAIPPLAPLSLLRNLDGAELDRAINP